MTPAIFVERPQVIDDATLQKECVEIAVDNSLISGPDAVDALNKICGLEMRFDEETQEKSRAMDVARMDALRAGMQNRNQEQGQQDEDDEVQNFAPEEPHVPQAPSEALGGAYRGPATSIPIRAERLAPRCGASGGH